MAKDALRAGMIGAGGFGRATLAALAASPLIELVGLSDRDAAAAERLGREYSVPAYSDNRSLLAESQPQAIFLAAPPMAAAEIISACAERGIHVWKELPLARDLAEGVALVRRMDQAGLKLAVGTQRRFAAGYRRAQRLSAKLGQVFLARAHYLFNWGPNLGWRGDKASAGGGAMMELGYHPIDLLVWLMGLPQEVYGISAAGAADTLVAAAAAGQSPAAQPPQVHDTDDTAAAILRYSHGRMATVVTTRAAGPLSEELILYGPAGSLRADGESCVLRDPEGNVLDQLHDDSPPQDVFRRQVEAFAQAVISGRQSYACSARENLLNLAVIEAAYLSGRTGQAESPVHLLKTHGLSPADCLKHQAAM